MNADIAPFSFFCGENRASVCNLRPNVADGTFRHFWANNRVSGEAVTLTSRHSHGMPCLQCELPNLLQESMPPDPDLVELIEQALIEGQIDSQRADLAYLWI